MSWILLLWACSGEPEQPATPAQPVDILPAVEPEPVPEPPDPPVPAFDGSTGTVPDSLRARMQGVSMHEGCPVDFAGLAHLQMNHWGYDGQIHRGELLVAREFAADLLGVFEQLFSAGFRIERMEPVSVYEGSDDKSMAANNTSGFNCRAKTGGTAWSQHSYGNAIDVNPLTNPYVRGNLVLPPAGKAFLDRTQSADGLIVQGDVVVTAFAGIGWKWGGDWVGYSDYQHFSSNGK